MPQPLARCDGLTVTDVEIRAQPPPLGGLFERVHLLSETVRLLHVTTKPELIRRFMILKEGERCSELRRAECERAAAELGVRWLSEADPAAAARLAEPLDRRAEHVLTEDARVDATVAALRADDLAAVGPLLDASHASLRDLYDASVPAVEQARERMLEAGAAGARMMGGGFGGSVLALFPPGVQPPPEAVAVEPGLPARVLA